MRVRLTLAVAIMGLVTAITSCGSGKAGTADPARLSELAAIEAKDLGAPWREQAAAGGHKPAPDTSCEHGTGAIAGLADDGRYESAVLQRDDATLFVRSTTTVFRDEAAAFAFLGALRADAYQTCYVNAITAEETGKPGAAPGASYRSAPSTDSEGPGQAGFEFQADYQYQATVDGALQDANGLKRQIVYRQARTIVNIIFEYVQTPGDPPELYTRAHAETLIAVQVALDRARKA